MIDKEILSIIETLKHFKYILVGRKIIVYTDHKNLTFIGTNYGSERVLRQRLVIYQFGAELRHISGAKNIVVDALSCLPTKDTQISRYNQYLATRNVPMEAYTYPITYEEVKHSQRECSTLQNDLLGKHK